MIDSTISSNSTRRWGGGIENRFGADLLVSNSELSENSAGSGGGIYNYLQGQLTITDSILSGNQATGEGGGLFTYPAATLTDSTVSENTAFSGGGIHGEVAMTNTAVSGNSAQEGGGMYGAGTVDHSTVSNNTATASGGGLHSWGSLILADSTVSGNVADLSGGGLYNDGGTLMLTKSTVSENSAAESGGGMQTRGMLALTDCTVSGNEASTGGAISGFGAMDLMSSTFTQNTSDLGSAIYVEMGVSCAPGLGCFPVNTLVQIGLTLVDGECASAMDALVTWSSSGYNIEGPGNTCGFDQSGSGAAPALSSWSASNPCRETRIIRSTAVPVEAKTPTTVNGSSSWR